MVWTSRGFQLVGLDISKLTIKINIYIFTSVECFGIYWVVWDVCVCVCRYMCEHVHVHVLM